MPVATTNPLSRAMRKMATSPAFRKVGPKVVPPLDRFLHHLTRGRVSVSGAIVPSLVLTTTGRKSGLPRLLDDAEKARVWPDLVAVWPAFDDYVEVSGRNLRVFHLEPVGG